MESSILAFSDHVLVPVCAVMAAIAELGVKGDGKNDAPKKLPLESLSADIVVYFMRNVEHLGQFLEEISRVLKPGGTVLIQAPQPTTLSTDKVKASKSSWKIGSSFSLKKATPSLLKVQLDDDLVLIDGVSLRTTEECLKKLELPVVDDCGVASSKKSFKKLHLWTGGGRRESC